jgi:hypothetical protein
VGQFEIGIDWLGAIAIPRTNSQAQPFVAITTLCLARRRMQL